ncbi:MAG: tetratricopeptide repeat protein [Chloroflexota bacterium]
MQKSENAKWQTILRNQKLANVKKWINRLESTTDIAYLINSEYENILRALESALQIPNAFDLAYKLTFLLHPIVIDSGDWNRWQIYLNQLSKKVENTNSLQQGHIFVQLGDVNSKLGESSKAEAFYRKGISHFKKISDLSSLAIALGRLAVVYANKNDLENAKRLCYEALDIAESTNDVSISSKISLNLSYIYYRCQDFESSLKFTKYAYSNFKNLKMKRDATKALLNIVTLSNQLGNWHEVELEVQSLLDELDVTSDITIFSQLKNIMGVAAFNQGEFAIAESNWHESLLLHTQINDLFQIPAIYNNLGMVYTKLNEWDAAKEMLLQAIEAYERVGDFYNIANSRDNLADFYIERKEFEAACKILQVAVGDLLLHKEIPNSERLITQMQEKLTSLHTQTH